MSNEIITRFLNSQSSIYRPLYLYGKNEVMNSATNELLSGYSASHPYASVCCYTGCSLVDSYMKSIRYNTTSALLSILCSCDLLVLKDIDYVAGRVGMMEQLYIVLDKRLETGKPFVVFGSKAPALIDGLAPRILAILEGSLIWELDSSLERIRLCPI